MEAPPRPVRRSRVWATVALVAVVLTLLLAATGAQGPIVVIGPSLVAGAAAATAIWAVWRLRAERAEYEARLTAWAATEAVLAERLRLARDLHDIVSHGLGLITVRAAATRHLAKSPELEAALTDIEETARRATGELRRTLGGLRRAGAPLAPLEGLADLGGILRGVEPTGLRVTLRQGELGEVSQGVQVAVCQIVREALGNAARHAGPTTAAVELRREGPDVLVTVVDDGPVAGWRQGPGAGLGLVGLRERVAGLGGELVAGPAGGGFRVGARLPDAPS